MRDFKNTLGFSPMKKQHNPRIQNDGKNPATSNIVTAMKIPEAATGRTPQYLIAIPPNGPVVKKIQNYIRIKYHHTGCIAV